MEGMMENTFFNIKNKSFTITAAIDISRNSLDAYLRHNKNY